MSKIRVLFVCLGNICRSPMAEGVFRHLVEREGLHEVVEIDSAGTGAWHVGEPPDSRAQAAAARRGVDLSNQRARKVRSDDFSRFDYILAMDMDNHQNLMRMAPAAHKDRIRLFLEFAAHQREREVPDPYYGGEQGFEHALDLVEAASQGLLADIRQKLK